VRLQVDPEVTEACGADPAWLCRTVFDVTDNGTAAETADFLVGTPLRIVLIIGVAWVLNRVVRRAIRRFVTTIASGVTEGRLRSLRDRAPGTLLAPAEVPSLRAAARAETIGAVLRSLATVVVWFVASLTVLGEVGIDLAPLIAGAGVAGVAVGFGAQSLVKDFLSGIFMLIEDQYGVGDVVDLGEVTGTVDAVTLRSTRLRDLNGTVWHIPNGEIRRVGNRSQQWARALVDVPVAALTDVRHAEQVIKRVADEVWHDEQWAEKILEEPEVWGVERLGADGVDIRLVVKTQPAAEAAVLRALRARIKEAFEAEGIEMPMPPMRPLPPA
jgi:moderate conductance mechanosensitive channel